LFRWYEQETARLLVGGAAPSDTGTPGSSLGAGAGDFPMSMGVSETRGAAKVVFAAPHSLFQTSSGARYAASETGEIVVSDPDDRRDLLRAGCTSA